MQEEHDNLHEQELPGGQGFRNVARTNGCGVGTGCVGELERFAQRDLVDVCAIIWCHSEPEYRYALSLCVKCASFGSSSTYITILLEQSSIPARMYIPGLSRLFQSQLQFATQPGRKLRRSRRAGCVHAQISFPPLSLSLPFPLLPSSLRRLK